MAFGGAKRGVGRLQGMKIYSNLWKLLHFFLSESDSAGAAAAGHLASFEDLILCLAARKSFIMKLQKV